MSMAPKWTDETRRRRWIRAYVVNGACIVAATAQILYAHFGCPIGYSSLFNGVNDPTNVIRVGATVSLSAALICGYGVVLCFMLARRNGQWAGGYLTANVYVFLVSSLMLCFALVVVSSTTLHLALNLRMSKSLFDRFMRLYMSRVAVKKVFDKIQRELHCCGNKRYDDWFDVPWARSSSLATGEYIGFPVSCCNTAMTAKGATCISTVQVDRVGDLQPYLEGCHEALRHHFRSSMMTLTFISLPMTIAFFWNTINVLRTVTSRPFTAQDAADELRLRQAAVKRRAQSRRDAAKRRVEAMRKLDEVRAARKLARASAAKRSDAVSRVLERDRRRREDRERRQAERDRAQRLPLERALIEEERSWEREMRRRFREEEFQLATQEKAIIEEQERQLKALAPVMQQLKNDEQAVLMDEQRRIRLLLPKTSSSFLLNKD